MMMMIIIDGTTSFTIPLILFNSERNSKRSRNRERERDKIKFCRTVILWTLNNTRATRHHYRLHSIYGMGW